jgi:hypothetical protein
LRIRIIIFVGDVIASEFGQSDADPYGSGSEMLVLTIQGLHDPQATLIIYVRREENSIG